MTDNRLELLSKYFNCSFTPISSNSFANEKNEQYMVLSVEAATTIAESRIYKDLMLCDPKVLDQCVLNWIQSGNFNIFDYLDFSVTTLILQTYNEEHNTSYVSIADILEMSDTPNICETFGSSIWDLKKISEWLVVTNGVSILAKDDKAIDLGDGILAFRLN